MKKLLLVPALALFAASPAYATSSLLCSTAGANPIEVHLVIGNNAVSAIFQARLIDKGRNIPVTVAQSWLERNEVRADLVDPNIERHELRLRAKLRGKYYDGSIWRGGKRRWVRCREG